MKSLQGQLLIAAPRLVDSNFRHAVVLMVQHNESGALGLILNRPTETPLAEVWDQVSQTPCATDERLHLGGPVQGPLMALHARDDLGEVEVVRGLHFCAEPSKLETLVASSDDTARYFVGYSGWGAGQLEHEMQEGSWLTCAAAPAHAFDPVEDLWQRVTRQIADSAVIGSLKIKHIPPDPSLN